MMEWEYELPPENGRRVIAARSDYDALFYGQYRDYPFPRIVRDDGRYITRFYAWIYEPDIPPLQGPPK